MLEIAIFHTRSLNNQIFLKLQINLQCACARSGNNANKGEQ